MWQLVAKGQDVYSSWSPDGKHLLVEVPDGPGKVVLLTAGGAELASYPGLSRATWLTAQQFLAYRTVEMPALGNTDFEPIDAVIGDTSATGLTDLAAPCCAGLSNGAGAMAFVRLFVDDNDEEQARLVVWTPDGQTPEREGYPVAWSPAGDLLAVLHRLPEWRDGGWLEVLRWPGLDPVFADSPERVASEPRFDPTGRFVAFQYVGDDTVGEHGVEIDVLSLETGAMARIPVTNAFSFAWNDASELLIASVEDERIETYAPSGTKVESEAIPPLTVIESSADGSTLLRYGRDDGSRLTYVREGVETQLPLPPGRFSHLNLAPDGKYVVITTFVGQSRSAFLAIVP